ncbi:lamin tail domain-containing protein [Nannocystis punicea]|uniref:Lamin tail domain-containing protein n=1 Tax=Nannocystis punicea TaxID=2995304 RepID=A0ABY7GW94_9BACT|nr:lamin tail domain-containing protein [Nannocystis poenicansa]WAS91258.1 lamin tail domain-containing protein [Nannocystis poenicansa]
MSTLPPRLAVLLLLVPACTDDSMDSTQGSATAPMITSVGATQTTTSMSATSDESTTAIDPTTGVATTEDEATSTTSTATEASTDATTGTTTGVVESCEDGQHNGSETDVDCGGPGCPACADGSACAADSDCAGASCVDQVCGPPAATCVDEAKNGAETDVDCGGADCPACGESQACEVDVDCATQSCVDGSCAAPTCDDSVANGEETDVDCGGPECDPCGDALGCEVGPDCESGVCDGGQCAIPLCDDGAENGDETDVDCGGDSCDPCGDGLQCEVDGDCVGHDCTGGTCVGSSCDDGVKNGGETGIDCGGPDCAPCLTSGLVINEVDYDQPSNDNAEFIELLNTSAAPIDLSNHAVVLVNGANNSTYATINLAGTIQPGQYLVLANANFAVPAPALKVTIANGIVQNGGTSPDGIAIVDKSGQTLVDALSYDGPITSVNIAGLGNVSLVEGAALPNNVIDNPSGAGSLARLPNGQDGNNSATDWKFTKNLTPAAANVP